MGRLARFVGLILMGTVLVTVAPAEAATSGGKCPKAGRVQTTKGVKYKCTKSGKNLKWIKVASTIANKNVKVSKGVNGPVGITSWTTSVTPNPVKPGAQFSITSIISCGPIMSLTGSPRYPEMQAARSSGPVTGDQGRCYFWQQSADRTAQHSLSEMLRLFDRNTRVF